MRLSLGKIGESKAMMQELLVNEKANVMPYRPTVRHPRCHSLRQFQSQLTAFKVTGSAVRSSVRRVFDREEPACCGEVETGG